MKKIILIMLFLIFSNTAFSACLPGAPSGWNGYYPIQINNWAWSGTISPNLFTKTAKIKNTNGSIVGTFPITNISSSCSGSQGWTQFKIPNIGNGNTWIGLQKFSGFNNWKHEVLWNGTVYSRAN